MRKRITPSLVISIIALVVALGGASYAAVQIPKNSVGTKQLMRNSVSKAKLKKNSVNSAKVRNGSLLRSDFKAGQLPGMAYYRERPTVPLLLLTGSFSTVVSTAQLPRGSYVLAARANLYGSAGDSSAICSMAGDAAQNFAVGSGEGVALSMSAVAVLDDPGQITLKCLANGGNTEVGQAHIIATRVTKIAGAIP
jgi:hypothetical protein